MSSTRSGMTSRRARRRRRPCRCRARRRSCRRRACRGRAVGRVRGAADPVVAAGRRARRDPDGSRCDDRSRRPRRSARAAVNSQASATSMSASFVPAPKVGDGWPVFSRRPELVHAGSSRARTERVELRVRRRRRRRSARAAPAPRPPAGDRDDLCRGSAACARPSTPASARSRPAPGVRPGSRLTMMSAARSRRGQRRSRAADERRSARERRARMRHPRIIGHRVGALSEHLRKQRWPEVTGRRRDLERRALHALRRAGRRRAAGRAAAPGRGHRDGAHRRHVRGRRGRRAARPRAGRRPARRLLASSAPSGTTSTPASATAPRAFRASPIRGCAA